MQGCTHSTLCLEPSSHARGVAYHRPNLQERTRATQEANDNTSLEQKRISCPASFPAPLVLPGDDLALDPGYPPQSVQEWLRDEDRNEVTSSKNVIYVVAPPFVQPTVDYVSTWTHPLQQTENVACPDVQSVLEYLRAFFYGLPVELLASSDFSFTDWRTKSEKSKTKSLSPRFIGLDTSTECIRIRTRPSADGIFIRQLNLDDLLDAAISILPEDAFALLLLTQHDLYENADDVFTCGRAYGGSRVAVISIARYHPCLDQRQNVEREHAWPASHCRAYVEASCAQEALPATTTKKGSKGKKTNSIRCTSRFSPQSSQPSGLQAAVAAYNAVCSANATLSPAGLATLWLGRVCRTASHELGHCFGIDHCAYYACAMQGSASLAEDARQPIYLCPIDLTKLLHATGVDMVDRYAALLAFCEEQGQSAMFAAFGAWLRARIEELSKGKEAKKLYC